MQYVVPAAVLLLATAASPAARAHAFLDHADPAVGGTVLASPSAIRLWFTEAIEPAFSKVELDRADGALVPAGPAAISPQDHSELDLRLAVRLVPGSYKVRWQVVAIDTHRTEGSFTFEVKP